MAEVSRSTKIAVVEETTKGTPVAASGNNDMLSAQSDQTLEGAFANLENDELTGSIGNAAPVLGVEEPTGSLSHYLRHSGTEGDIDAGGSVHTLIKGAFGSEDVAGSELVLAGGSTTTVLKYADTSSLTAGEALLIKDGTNGYSIRNIASVDNGTDVTLAFALANAPAATVATGKAIHYQSPAAADSDYKGLSMWQFAGNGGAQQLMAGARVTEMTADFAAGEFINSNFSMSGLNFSFNPFEVTASNQDFDLTDDSGTIAGEIPLGWYKDPHDYAAAATTAATAASVGSGDDVITVTYSDTTGKFSWATDGTTLSLLSKTGTSGSDNTDTHCFTVMGFDDSADDTGSTSYEADDAQDYSSSYSAPSVDPLVAKSNEIFIGDAAQSACTDSVATVSMSIANELVDVLDVCAESGKSDNIFNSHELTVEVDLLLERYDADNWKRFRAGDTTSFAYNFGSKSGGNWEDGKSGALYIKNAKIDSFVLGDRDGLINITMNLTGFSDSGAKVGHLNFV